MMRTLVYVALLCALVGAPAEAFAGGREKGLTPPAKIGPYVRYASVKLNKTGAGLKVAKVYAGWAQKTGAVLSKAYGGAPAVSERYADQSLSSFVVLNAVRAPSPKLWTAYTDAAYFRLARPQMETRTFGDVTCLVSNQPTPKGQTPAKDSAVTVRCQRSDAHLTVMIDAQGPVGRSPSAVAALVDDAWDSLS